MQDKLNRRNLNRKLTQDNSSKPEIQSKNVNQQTNGSTNQMSNSQAKPMNEAIDVLSYMGFKL